MMSKSKKKIRKGQFSQRLKVCIFLGTFTPKRHILLKKILETQNVEVQVCCETIHGRFSIIFANIKLFFRHLGLKYDVLLIPWWGIFTFPLANLICRKPIVYKASLSFYKALINEIKRDKPSSINVRLYHFLEHYALKHSDKVITESDSQISYLSKEYNIPKEKFEISVPSADETLFKPITLKEQRDCFNVLFFGTFAILHGTDTIIQAAKILSNNKDIIFNFCGDGLMKKSVEKFSKDHQLENVNFFGFVKNEVLLEKIMESDIMLGVFGKSGIADDSITNKVCQALASQKPLITLNSSALKEVNITNNEHAILVPPGDPQSLADSILLLKQKKELREKIAVKGYELYKKKLSMDETGRKLVTLMSALSHR